MSGFFSQPFAPFLAAVALTIQPAIAQTIPTITNPVPPVQPPSSLPKAEAAPPIQVAPEAGGEAPMGADAIKVQLNSITVAGSTVYSDEELQPLYADLIGKEIKLSDIFAVAQALTQKYRADGYILSRAFVPAQRVGDGKFTIKVVEGYVSDILVRGDVGDVVDQVKAYLANILESKPANIRDIERYLLLANDLPGLTVRGTFRAGSGEAGSKQLVVDVARVGIGGFMSYDNRGSRFLGPGEFTAGINERSFTSYGERLDLIWFNTANIAGPNPIRDIRSVDKQRFYELTFQAQIGGDGLQFRGFAGGGPSHPGYYLTPLNYHSDLFTGGAALFYPVIRSRRLNLGVTGQFDITNSQVYTGASVLNSQTFLRVLRGTVSGDLSDSWGGISSAEFTAHQGLSILSASGASALAPRPGVSADFAKLTTKFTRTQSLWSGESDQLSLYLEAVGQYSFSVLYPVEEFRVGGSSLGRGYFNGRLAGDDGFATTAELRYDSPGDFLWTENALPIEYYLFYDFGKIWSKAKGDPTRKALASVGAGVRVPVLDWLRLEAELVKPLTLSTIDVISGSAPKPPVEFFGRLTVTF